MYRTRCSSSSCIPPSRGRRAPSCGCTLTTHTVGMADMGRLVVVEGPEYWACVQVDTGGLEWVVVTACRLRRQQSRGPACYRVFREYLRELGPVRRAHRCTAGDIPQAPAVFVEVTRPPKVQGQDVWPGAPSNMW